MGRKEVLSNMSNKKGQIKTEQMTWKETGFRDGVCMLGGRYRR